MSDASETPNRNTVHAKIARNWSQVQKSLSKMLQNLWLINDGEKGSLQWDYNDFENEGFKNKYFPKEDRRQKQRKSI